MVVGRYDGARVVVIDDETTEAIARDGESKRREG
jgi:hypothetical protein